MTKIVNYLVFIVVFLLLVTGCSRADNNGNSNSGRKANSDNNIHSDINTSKSSADITTFQAEVIKAGDTLLIAPDKDSKEYASSDKISVNTLEAEITNQHGIVISLKDLIAGDILQITYHGMMMESYPAQITASAIVVTEHDFIIEGYLALIDDICKEDSGLNSDITMISLDTTGWVELSDSQKEIIFSRMQEVYGVDILEGTFDELAEQGLIDKETLYYPKGVHITLTNIKINKDKDKITCSIEKWRSGDGAIGSNEVTAKYKDGNWTINKKDMWIS